MPPIDRVLADLQAALRRGDFAELSAISATLDTVSLPADPAILQRAARIARENAPMLAASIQGIRAASRRLTELQNGRQLTTYDGTGRRIDRAEPGTEPKRI